VEQLDDISTCKYGVQHLEQYIALKKYGMGDLNFKSL
jgi:hypothetical protein